MFKEENPTLKIGISKYAELHPPNVLLSSLTPANLCTCIYHQNMFLALDAIHLLIPSITSYNHELPNSCLIDSANDDCWFGTCKHQGCGFQFAYPLPENVRDVEVKWWKWREQDGRLVKEEEKGSIADLYDYITNMSKKFLQHCHIKRLQAKRYEGDKQIAMEANSKVAVLQLDFAENYWCIAQDEVQSAHWNQAQVTLFTTVAWICVIVKSEVVISNYMHHNKTAVIVFLNALLESFPSQAKEIEF